jgi:hypothetical protein
MDSAECQTVIAAARSTAGMTREEILASLAEARRAFSAMVSEKFKGEGEW